jgi:CRISPR-associated protein (TIGR03984 family)
MIERKIERVEYQVKGNIEVADPLEELETQVETGKYTYLLAHAYDGVIWGFVKEKKLHLSGSEDAFPEISPRLRIETLSELRLFGGSSEWHLWRADDKWLSCMVTDGIGETGSAFDEQYILWGTESDGPQRDGFWPVRESDLGIVHTLPIQMKERHALKISVRHYLQHDEAGVAYVALSRLTGLTNGGAA